MPMYEYQCASCGHRLTARQGINDARLSTCPVCEEEALQRLISQTSFVLKGGGWYASGYQKGNSASESTSGDSSDATTSDATTSDATKAAPAPSATSASSESS